MKKQWIIACLIGIQGVNVQAQQPSKYPYQDTKLTAEQRADDLLQRLTLEEKVALMQNNSPAIPRLGIKPYEWWNEALHGVARAGLATVFPQAIGMAASFNDELLYEVFDAVSDEARAKNRQFNEKGQYKRYQGLTMWTPNVNIFRDPRWGRGQETYGEDPYLSGRMGMRQSEVCKDRKMPNMTNFMPAPNTLPYTRVPNGTVTASTQKTLHPETYGKPTFLLSRNWYKKQELKK